MPVAVAAPTASTTRSDDVRFAVHAIAPSASATTTSHSGECASSVTRLPAPTTSSRPVTIGLSPRKRWATVGVGDPVGEGGDTAI